MEPSTADAISAPHWNTSDRMRSLTVPTGIVFMVPEDMKISAYRNSFHDRVKENIPAERMPGMASGMTMDHMARRRLAPSIMAHSSSSRGIVRKYPMSNQDANGISCVG